MAYCTKCGNQLPEDASFCISCGTAAANAEPQNVGYKYARPAEKKEVSKSPAVSAMVFSIVSLITSIFCYIPVVFFVFSVISFIFIVVARSNRTSYVRLAEEENGFTRTANICTIVAIPLTIFFTILGIVLTVAIFE